MTKATEYTTYILLPLIFLIVPPNHKARAQTTRYIDLRYADGYGVDHLLDLEVPDSEEPVPLVVFVHGGGWVNGDKASNRADVLVPYGYAVASINYRLSRTDTWPAQIHDCKAAIRWLRGNGDRFNIDTERIGVWGSSAGGHLVAMLGTTTGLSEVQIDTLTIDLEGDVGTFPEQSSAVQAVCDYYGPSDLLNTPGMSPGPITALLGIEAGQFPALAQSASPIYFVDPEDVPFLIFHGTLDPVVPLSHSENLHAALLQNQVPSTLVVLEGAGHGGLEFREEPVTQTIVQFFDYYLRKGPVAHWSFDETVRDIVYDISPNGLDGTLYSASRVTGIFNNGLDFNGVDQSVQIPALGAVPPDTIGNLEYGTIALWFKYRDFTEEMIPLFYFGESSEGSPYNGLIIEIGHDQPNNRKLYFTIFNAGFCFDSGQNLDPGRWYHFTAVVSPEGNTGYLDGQEMTGRNYNLGSDATHTDFFASVPVKEMLAIGYGRYGKADAFGWYNGIIDDVRIYSSPLSAEDIGNLYQAGIVSHVEKSLTGPRTFKLHQNYPNPFNPSTTIPFDLNHPSRVVINLYNIMGRHIVTLLDNHLPAGTHHIPFYGSDYPGGLYILEMQCRNEKVMQKMVLIK